MICEWPLTNLVIGNLGFNYSSGHYHIAFLGIDNVTFNSGRDPHCILWVTQLQKVAVSKILSGARKCQYRLYFVMVPKSRQE